MSPPRTEPSFTAINAGLESPHSSTFCAWHKTKASHNNCHGKDVRPTDCATLKIQNRKCQKTKEKGAKDKETFGDKFLGYRRYTGRFFWGCQTLLPEDFFYYGFGRHRR